jgi:shikimate dehydrogenase
MKYGVVGDPVMHSRSPAIHTAGFAALGIAATFEHLLTPRDSFDEIVARLRNGDLNGVSVTMPHKDNAFAAVDMLSEVAGRSEAVNTIIAMANGQLYGSNTDVAGVTHALGILSVGPRAPLLILGAGGAARAAVVAGARHPVFVSARRSGAATEVLDRTSVEGTVVPWGEGVAGAVVVNATPLGMKGESLPHGPLVVGSALLDMTYGSAETPACQYFRAESLPYADGLEMLVGQAVEAFELFTGLVPPLEVLRQAARTVG